MTSFADRLLPTSAASSVAVDSSWVSMVGDTAAIGVISGAVRNAAGDLAPGGPWSGDASLTALWAGP